jgi:hypothetical protein
MAASLELGALPLEVVELTVDDRVNALVLVGERLRAPLEIDDAKASVAEAYSTTRVAPESLAVWAAVVERRGRTTQRFGINGRRRREDSDDAAHGLASLSHVRRLGQPVRDEAGDCAKGLGVAEDALMAEAARSQELGVRPRPRDRLAASDGNLSIVLIVNYEQRLAHRGRERFCTNLFDRHTEARS